MLKKELTSLYIVTQEATLPQVSYGLRMVKRYKMAPQRLRFKFQE